MKNNPVQQYHAIGLMSGTSLDGLDLCYAKFTKSESGWDYKIIRTRTIPYDIKWQKILKESVSLGAEDLLELDVRYGAYLGEKVNEFRSELRHGPVDLIASHGHTVFHQPHRRFTRQIGDGRAIQQLNPIPVIYDFRSQDVIYGGQGAPLVPIGDELLFKDYDACLNLGGFSNISYQVNQQRIAFDIAPVNLILNTFSNQLGLPFDAEGKIAKKGIVNQDALDKLNSLPFYLQKPPKSLGVEWLSQYVWPLIKHLDPITGLATFTKHVSEQLALTFNQHQLKRILVTGGGAYNTYLLEQTSLLSSADLIVPSNEVVEFKEALIFAFMGILRYRNEPNVLSSVTGSPSDHCSGLLLN